MKPEKARKKNLYFFLFFIINPIFSSHCCRIVKFADVHTYETNKEKYERYLYICHH